jgi:hypothetical protein
VPATVAASERIMIAADNAAVADTGPTIRLRELPSSAYKINAGAAA